MKSLLIFISALGGFAYADGGLNYPGTPGAMQGSSPTTPTPPPVQHVETIPDEIHGKCETSTGGPIPFTVPCRNLELILMSDKKHEVARTNLDPQGNFTFSGLRLGTYALVVRSSKNNYESRMEGLKPGNSYTITPEIPDKK